MKIVFLADPLDNQYAGIHYYCKALLHAIDKIKAPEDEIFVQRIKSEKVFQQLKEIAIPSNILPRRLAAFYSIPKVISKLQPDVVVEMAHFGPFNLNKNIRRVTMIHDISPVTHPEWHSRLSTYAHRFLLPGIFKKSNGILTNSSFCLNEILRKYPSAKNKIKAIPLGVDTQFKKTLNLQILKKYNISSDYFLFVGTIEPRKNLETLINAYLKFRQKSKQPPDLVICGKIGWKVKELTEKIKRHKNEGIIHIGYADYTDLPALYSHAKAFIFPSLYEGYGLPVAEALSCETPVICSNKTAIPEVAGTQASYFDPENEKELLNHLLASENKLKKVSDYIRPSWEKCAQATLEFIKKGL